MAVRFQNGPESEEFNRVLVGGQRVAIAGQRVRVILTDEYLKDFLSVAGTESVQVQSEGQTRFRNESWDYVMRDGDTVSFSKAAGEKGK